MRRILSLLLAWVSLALCAQIPYTIYPVPHQQELTGGVANVGKQVVIVAEQGIDAPTIARAMGIVVEHGMKAVVTDRARKGETNLLLGVNGSRGIADKQAGRLKLQREVFGLPKYDRHILSITADKRGTAQIVALGENTDATFCALATLEQIFDLGQKALPCVTFYDYADIQNRGIIEGYYGVPYSAEVTKDLFRFMARYKMNTYMYGAKSDPYHSRYWAEPYPTEITPEQKRIGYLSQEMLRDITSVAHATKVNFIWAIHPGTAFVDEKKPETIGNIMKKFESMYGLGVRQFGVFVDDVGVPSDAATLKLGADRLTDLQQQMDARWNRPEAAPADTVKPLHYVPQLYAYSWVSAQRANDFFQALSHTPDKVNIYITGANVWSVPNNYDLRFVKKSLGRDTSWWWNYPCNDNDVTKLFPMDMYANFRDETHIDNLAHLVPDLTGTNTLIINPMQQGEISKIALFSVADYTWNQAGFNNQQSWEAALPAVVGEKYASALRKIAPYLRYYDADASSYLIENYKRGVANGNPNPRAVIAEMQRVEESCQVLKGMQSSPVVSDALFYEDVRPWLLKLEAMAHETIQRLQGESDVETVDLEGDKRFQFEILTGLGNEIALSVRTAEPSGQVLRPFLDWLRKEKK